MGDHRMPRRTSTCFVVTLSLSLSLSLAACSADAAPDGPYPVADAPLFRISADLESGRTTSSELTMAYIERIETMDEPLNGVIAIAPDALDQAAASDERRTAGQARGPLDGIPILLKDNLDALGMPTTAGSWALEANVPTEDSEVARRLRAAGAVILGKANTSQFAGFRSTGSFNGSTVGGSTHNPYDPTRSAAGSSNGSGISTAMGFAAATIGTETSGSIVGPSSVNGVVGMKPTVGLASRRGIVPISLTQDSPGPMARTVRDVAIVLDVIAGTDPGDPWSADADAQRKDYVAALSTEALRGKRLGVLRPTGGDADAVGPLFDAALEVLTAQGADLVELPPDAIVDVRPEMRVILLHDFKEDLNAYLAGRPESVGVRTLAELIAFSTSDPRERMHGVELWEAAQATEGGRRNPAYMEALANGRRLTREEGIDRLLVQHGLSALVAPTGGPAGELRPDGAQGLGPIPDAPRGTRPPSLTSTAAVAGYPLISVPMGLVEGMPVGISFVGTAWSEDVLLAIAHDYEQASQARVPPPGARAP